MVCSSPEHGPEAEAAQAVRDLIDLPGASVLGPAALFRRKGRERAQIVVKSAERGPAITAVRRAVEKASAGGHAGVSFAVDVDPQ